MAIKLGEKLKQITGFEWDEYNLEKIKIKYGVTEKEAEEIFFDSKAKHYPDPIHSENEIRKIIIGQTILKRVLFVVYTIRKNKIRVISARDLNKRKEGKLYEETY